MPFKSEKQRRYLWANEPEIAKDWTDTYGSRIHKSDGGITRIPFGLGSGYKSSLNKMTIKELQDLQKSYPKDTNISDAIETKQTERISGKVEKAGEGFWEQFPGFTTGSEQESALPFMQTLEHLKNTKGLDKFGAKRVFEEYRQIDPKGFEEKYGIDSYEDIGNAIEKGYDEARLSNEDYLNQMDKRQLTAGSGMFETDATYIPRNTAADMAANFYQDLDIDEEALGMNPTFEDIDEETSQYNTVNGLPAIKNKFNFPSLNFSNIGTGIQTAFALANDTLPFGLARRGFDALTSGFNRNRTMTPQQQANQNYINQYGRTPQGRLATGDFAGLNAPGTSMFGSKSQQEMAQNWMDKYGNVNYTTPKMQKKQTSIAAQAAGDGGNNNNAGAGGSDAGYAAAGGTGMHGGRHYNRGGLASLWQR